LINSLSLSLSLFFSLSLSHTHSHTHIKIFIHKSPVFQYGQQIKNYDSKFFIFRKLKKVSSSSVLIILNNLFFCIFPPLPQNIPLLYKER
jgi:hypothetical protein